MTLLQNTVCFAVSWFILLNLHGLFTVEGWRKSLRCNTSTEFECQTGLRCVPVELVCDRHPHCHDGSDEADCRCVQNWIPPMHRCRNKKCIDNFYTCNGKDDCGDGGSDEERCACYGFKCNNGDCILSTWRCDGYKDCKDYSDEIDCGSFFGDRRHPFLGLIGPIGCLVAAMAIRVLLRSHQRRRLLHNNGETARAAAIAALEARHGRYGQDESCEDDGGPTNGPERPNPIHWMDRVSAGITSSFSQLRLLLSQTGQQAGVLRPPPYTESVTQPTLPPAYLHHGNPVTPANTEIPPVFLLVIPAGKPPPTYNESMSLPDLVQSTSASRSAQQTDPDAYADVVELQSPNDPLTVGTNLSHSHRISTSVAVLPSFTDAPSAVDMESEFQPFVPPSPLMASMSNSCGYRSSPEVFSAQNCNSGLDQAPAVHIQSNPMQCEDGSDGSCPSIESSDGLPPAYDDIFLSSSADSLQDNIHMDANDQCDLTFDGVAHEDDI